MLFGGTLATRLVLIVLAVSSLISWILIFWKAKQFRAVRRQGDRFLQKMERATGLADAYKAVLLLPESPYGRVFRGGMNFFSELRPGALREGAPPSEGLTVTQLQVLKLVLEKEEAEERDELAEGLIWLAVLGSVAPLMGLMGTVPWHHEHVPWDRGVRLDEHHCGGPGRRRGSCHHGRRSHRGDARDHRYNHFLARLNLVSGELEGFSSEFIGTLAREGTVMIGPSAAIRLLGSNTGTNVRC